jgi:hypothetical protein
MICTSTRGAKLAALGLFVPAAVIGLAPTAHAAPVAKQSPTLMSLTPGSETVGGTTTDTATLSGAFFPTNPPTGYVPGTLTFTLYGPFTSATIPTASCKTANLAPLGASDVNQAVVTPTANSFGYAPTAVTPQVAGYYVWNVLYSGDKDNNGAQNFPTTNNACSTDVVQLVTASPTLSTTPSPPPTP